MSIIFMGYEMGSNFNNKKEIKEIIHVNEQVKAIADASMKSQDITVTICIVVFVVLFMDLLLKAILCEKKLMRMAERNPANS